MRSVTQLAIQSTSRVSIIFLSFCADCCTVAAFGELSTACQVSELNSLATSAMAVQWHSLPDECWQVILAFLPLVERIRCSSVSAKLHNAAVAATNQLHVQQAPKHVASSMMLWIEKYGQQIISLRFLSGLGFAMTRLACPNLQELQLEHVDVQLGSTMQSPGVLTVCTALTKLQLRCCSVLDAYSGLGVLAWVPALQHLELTGLQQEDGQSTQLPPFVLQHLTNLTFLSVSTSSRFLGAPMQIPWST